MNRGQKKLKIGIPRTLFSSYHLTYWRQMITLSGMEAILSEESSKETAERGGRRLPHEFCIPIKVFIGHILNLLDKGVDQILLPRMITKGKANFFVPSLSVCRRLYVLPPVSGRNECFRRRLFVMV